MKGDDFCIIEGVCDSNKEKVAWRANLDVQHLKEKSIPHQPHGIFRPAIIAYRTLNFVLFM